MSGTFNPFTMIGDNLMSSSLPWFWVKVAAWLFISIGRQQRYYNPWSREHPVIIRDKAQMDELSAATELSQPAVYADVCLPSPPSLFSLLYTKNLTRGN
ncbi:MAG: hypothetical protein LQ342_000558 [Letrouitia transgressa]|nr:MAG: hypothetical protein LQ342_000558 [Letrouitia transgressa]